MVGRDIDVLTKTARNLAKCCLDSVVHNGILPELLDLFGRFGDFDDLWSAFEWEYYSALSLADGDEESIGPLVIDRTLFDLFQC